MDNMGIITTTIIIVNLEDPYRIKYICSLTNFISFRSAVSKDGARAGPGRGIFKAEAASGHISVTTTIQVL